MGDLRDTFFKLCDNLSKRGIFCDMEYSRLYNCLADAKELSWGQFAHDIHVRFQQTQILIWDEANGLWLPSNQSYYGNSVRVVILAKAEPVILNCLVKLACLNSFDVIGFDRKFTSLLPELGLSLSVYFTNIRPTLDIYFKNNDHQSYLDNWIKLVNKFLMKIVLTDEVEGIMFDHATNYSSDLPLYLLWLDPKTALPTALRVLNIVPLKDDRPRVPGEIDDLFAEDTSWAAELDRQMEILSCSLATQEPAISEPQNVPDSKTNKKRKRTTDSKAKSKAHSGCKKSKKLSKECIPRLIRSPDLPPKNASDISDTDIGFSDEPAIGQVLNCFVEDGCPNDFAELFAEEDISTLNENLAGRISSIHGALTSIFGAKLDTADEMFGQNLDRVAKYLPADDYQTLAVLFVSRVVRDRISQSEIIHKVSPFLWRLAAIMRKSNAKFSKLESFLDASRSAAEMMHGSTLDELHKLCTTLDEQMKASLVHASETEKTLTEFRTKFSQELNGVQNVFIQRLSKELNTDRPSEVIGPQAKDIFKKVSVFWEASLDVATLSVSVFENFENLSTQTGELKKNLSSFKEKLSQLIQASDQHLFAPISDARAFDAPEFRNLVNSLQTILAPIQLFADQFDNRKLHPWQLFEAQLNNVKSFLKGRPSKQPRSESQKKRVSKKAL